LTTRKLFWPTRECNRWHPQLFQFWGIQNNEKDLTDSGQGFIYSSAAAGVVGAAPSTSSPMMLWNPSDSGVNLRILEIRFGAVSGTVIAGHISYGILFSAGAQIGTAQPIVSATFVNPVNLFAGRGLPSKIRFAPATVTFYRCPIIFDGVWCFCWWRSGRWPTHDHG